MDTFLLWWFWLPLSLVVISIVAFGMFNVLHKKKSAGISLCFSVWMTLSFLLPLVTKKYGIFKSRWIAWLLMFVSPAAIATYYIIAIVFLGISPDTYSDLEFTDKESIVALVGLPEYPDYDYLNNSYDLWEGTHYVRYSFKEELTAAFLKKLESQCKLNEFWYIDSLRSNEDKTFFGSDCYYVYKHGWDGKYISAPNPDMPENANIEFFIGKKSFICKYNIYHNLSMDRFGNRDSLSSMTGVRFPPYTNIDCGSITTHD